MPTQFTSTLDNVANRRYGPWAQPAIKLQIANLKDRFRAFSHVQAARVNEGWRISDIEVELRCPIPESFVKARSLLKEQWEEMELVCRIDRIDRHSSGRVMILDYKTGDSGIEPKKAHLKGGEWKDLQLPIYENLLGAELGEPVCSGYILLPKDADRVGFAEAQWESDEKDSSVSEIDAVLASIIQQDFWPPASEAPLYDDFAEIVGTPNLMIRDSDD